MEMAEEKSEVKNGKPEGRVEKRKVIKKKKERRCKHGYLITRDGLFVCSKCKSEL